MNTPVLKILQRISHIMGTSVSVSTSPEPEEPMTVETALDVLIQSPLRMGSMLRLCSMISECNREQKEHLVRCGIVNQILDLITDFHHGSFIAQQQQQQSDAGQKTGAGTGAAGDRNMAKKQNKLSPSKTFVSHIAFGRRKVKLQPITRGTGYGTGSTRSQWDIERYIEKIMLREEQTIWLLNAFNSFLYRANPSFNDVDAIVAQIYDGEDESEGDGEAEGDSEEADDESRRHPLNSHLTAELVTVITSSSLVPMIRCHLKNESIFDVSEHLEFYQSLLETICCMAMYRSLADLIFLPSRDGPSIALCLMPRFRSLIVTYLNFLRDRFCSSDLRLVDFLHKVDTCCRLLHKIHCRSYAIGMQHSELDLSFPAVALTVSGVAAATAGIAAGTGAAAPAAQRPLLSPPPSASPFFDVHTADGSNQDSSLLLQNTTAEQASLDYVGTLKSLQITSWKLVANTGQFLYPYTFRKEAKALNLFSPTLKDRSKRIAKEIASLRNNLPLEASNSIFVCIDDSRCDIMKVLITGPDETPYQNGCFEFDLFFPSNYPFSPPKMAFLTTSGGDVRFNPNLYQDGKVCLSILNTWEGRPEEKWNQFCTLLQLLVSVQALIFVKEPYFNEPGFEKYIGTEDGQHLSKYYNQQLRQATLQYAILDQLKKPPEYFRDVIRRQFWLKRNSIVEQAQRCLKDMSRICASESKRKNKCPLSGATDCSSFQSVKQTVETLIEELSRLEC